MSLSEAVVKAVAREEGVDAENLEPLYEVIDGDALDALFRGGQGQVTFRYAGYEVTVDQLGTVSLTPRASQE